MPVERVIDLNHPENLTPSQEGLITGLYEIEAVKFGAFPLKLHDKFPEAPKSPVYIDLRMVPRDVKTKSQAVSVYQELSEPLEFDWLAGIPLSAVAMTSSLSDRLGVGMITPRTDAKTHGTGAKIDGILPKDSGQTVLVIDDLITRADSKIEAIDILVANGMVVKDVVVLIDRDQGGREQLSKRGVNLHSAFTMQQMLDYYLRVGTIDNSQYGDAMYRLDELNRFLGTAS